MDRFDLNDFREQLERMKEMGPLRSLMTRIPGMGQMGMDSLAGIDVESEVRRIQGIIESMTPDERRDPGLIDLSRRRRIAAGSHAEPADVAGLLKQFDAMSGRWRKGL